MLWYGFLYYFIVFFSVAIFSIIFLRFFYLFSLIKKIIFDINSKLLLSLISYLTIFLLIVTYHFYFCIEYALISSVSSYNLNIFSINSSINVLSIFINYTGISIYYFPFIYIFILITVLSILFCLSYNFNEINGFVLYCINILIAGTFLFFTDSLILFFFAYEMLLIPSFFILYKFAKTRRCIEAAYLMFFWTQFGALWLIFSFIYIFYITQTTSFATINVFPFSTFEINFFFFCWIFGFGVKLPIWPFYNWLPKAHVEASTNFSIFLSGVLVKFAFFGLLKCLLTVQLEPTFFLVFPFLIVGIVDAVFKLFYQIDLKKLVAYSTVVEMHWLTICIISGQSALMLAGFCMLISHALLSTNSFLLVDAINRRFKTRLITEISGLNFLCPKLFLLSLINCLVFLGFPGSIFFIAEFLFFSFCMDIFPLITFLLILLLYFFAPTFFFRSWMNVMFGYSTASLKTLPVDLNLKELCLYSAPLFLMFWLGISWQTFLF